MSPTFTWQEGQLYVQENMCLKAYDGTVHTVIGRRATAKTRSGDMPEFIWKPSFMLQVLQETIEVLPEATQQLYASMRWCQTTPLNKSPVFLV